jgi:DNA/RNA-binding domain of Phe-tRNA-synthetase-like protein
MDDTLLLPDSSWSAAPPGAAVGAIALAGAANPAGDPTLAALADRLEAELRARYGALDRAALLASAPYVAYAAWYRRFGQRYHVALQLESVVKKGKSIPRVAALVGAMFLAELDHGILTAGHDGDAVALPLRAGVGSGADAYRGPSGAETAVKAGDLFTTDDGGVLSAIVTGPSDRARIGPATTAALYVAYAPPGVSAAAIEAHLAAIADIVRSVSPEATVAGRGVVTA